MGIAIYSSFQLDTAYKEDTILSIGVNLTVSLAVSTAAIQTKPAYAGYNFPDRLDSTLDLLVRRELIEQADNLFCFQVELIRRWFAQKR